MALAYGTVVKITGVDVINVFWHKFNHSFLKAISFHNKEK
jgi:hypothetical protein